MVISFLFKEFINSLPFKLTTDQKYVIKDILEETRILNKNRDKLIDTIKDILKRNNIIVDKVNYAELFNTIRRKVFIRNPGILFSVLF